MSDLTDGPLFPHDPERRKREMMVYGQEEVPRAAALVKAFLLFDLGALRALGPAQPGGLPEGWVDALGYGPDQATDNPDHLLIFAQILLLLRLAREWQISPATVAATIDRILLLPPPAGERRW